MKILDLRTVTDSSQFPLKVGTLNFINLAYQEVITALLNNLIGQKELTDGTKAYILYGCVNTGTYPTYNISEGAIFWLNPDVYGDGTNVAMPEIALVAGMTTPLTVTSPHVAVAIKPPAQLYYGIDEGAYADAVTFTDGASRKVHLINKLTFVEGAAGVGFLEYGNLMQTAAGLKNDQQATTLSTAYTVTFEQDKATFFPAQAATTATVLSFDFTNAIPGAVVRLKISAYTGSTLTITTTGISVKNDSGTFTAGAMNLMYFIYCGKNESGLNEVSYTVKQV